MTHPRTPDALEPDTFRRIEAILDAALDLEGEARRAHVDAACAGDAALRARIEALLAADAEADPLLDAPIGPRAARLLDSESPAGTDLTGRRFGPWRATRELGHGGSGTVWLAERADGAFEQQVAIKLVPATLASPVLRARFEQERRILARLEHPCIARLVDGGITPEGLPWLAMEYVDGEPITAWCARRRAPLDVRLRLFADVARGVAAAHQRLVVHRDLKPANILVSESGRVKLLDFGIARLLEPGVDADATLTIERRLTPRYAAPEQLRSEAPTTATDVWALGVLLYELLSGRHPFGEPGTRMPELERAVLERDPPAPGAAFDGERAAGLVRRDVHRELDAIVLLALRKAPEARYPSALAMLEDLDRHREGRPVRAAPYTARDRALRFARRNRGALVAAALVLTTLIAGLAATAWQARVAREQRDRATRVLAFLVGTLGGVGPERLSPRLEVIGSADPDRPVRDVIIEAARRARAELHDDATAEGAIERALGEILLAQRRDAEADTALAAAAAAFALAGDAIARADAEHLRAIALEHRGALAEAESLARVATEFRRTRPEHAADLAQMLSTLAAIQRRRRDPGAGATVAEARAVLEGRVPEDDPIWLDVLNAQALEASAAGHPAAAESLLRRLLPLAERRLGSLHPRTLTLRNNLGTSLVEQQRWAAAESLYRRLADDRRRVLGADHADVVSVLNSLAIAMREQGRLAGADSLFREVVAQRTRLLGPEARETLSSLSGLGITLRLEGRAAEAEGIARSILAIRRRTLPAGDPLLASSLTALGEALAVQRRFAEAERALVEALAIREAVRPRNEREVEKAKRALDRLRSAGGS